MELLFLGLFGKIGQQVRIFMIFAIPWHYCIKKSRTAEWIYMRFLFVIEEYSNLVGFHSDSVYLQFVHWAKKYKKRPQLNVKSISVLGKPNSKSRYQYRFRALAMSVLCKYGSRPGKSKFKSWQWEDSQKKSKTAERDVKKAKVDEKDVKTIREKINFY